MKALLTEKYGHPEEVLRIGEAPKPVPSPNEVLVRIKATTVNDYDWSLVTGKPYLYRLIFGLKRPKNPIPGMEMSGIIEEVGADIRSFKVGDEVFGDTSDSNFGTFAEYICLPEKSLLHKPKEISFEQAASIPHASALAYQSLTRTVTLQEGQKILINGAGGGVGSVAIQLAKQLNCEITGVDSKEKHPTMQEMGCHHVTDYRTSNFTRLGEQYDIILDCKSNKPALTYLRALKPQGTYVTVGGTPAKLIALLFWGQVSKLFTKKRLKILALKPNQHLDGLMEMYKTGKVLYTIDGPHKFKDAPRLIQYFGEGRHEGKVVVRVGGE